MVGIRDGRGWCWGRGWGWGYVLYCTVGFMLGRYGVMGKNGIWERCGHRKEGKCIEFGEENRGPLYFDDLGYCIDV